ncbi:MAG: HD domain-containing protein [Melioribacteraceae bacterium]|nr:HD domain-containing protein [Melioribacteraceae bacterium]MCF8393336.1 HD domain-containing protein [Melioribacteraceae bacterium]MCF8418901.1 HD domain-containing protein [Melioribacteraceae bacterium]
MPSKKELIDIQVGEQISQFFILTKVEKKLTRAGKPYLNLMFRDKSAEVTAKMWDNFEDFEKTVSDGSIVKVAGTIEDFQGQKQVKIDKIRLAIPSDNVKHESFLPKSKRSLEEMITELKERLEKVEEPLIKELLDKILTDEKFEKYTKVPAGKAWHHAYIGGLIEHTLEIIKICDLMCDIHPEINRDILIAGAALHDFGKTEELTFETGFDYTDKGKLLGHIVIAAMEIESKTKEIEGFPEKLKDQIIHLVLSHQGKLEFASPVEPKTLEAIVLYHADELSAKTNAYKSAIQAEETSENIWTRYLPLANTSLYISKNDNEKDFKENLFE